MPEMDPMVKIENGILKGLIRYNWLGGKYYCFLGIPYAKPPVGKLRFKAPQPADPWNGIRNATEEGNVCVQRGLVRNKMVGSEDCLVLHVYTPQLPDGIGHEPKAVMVYIHGGAFLYGGGSPDYHGPDFLIAEDVVMVSINYRFGLLGFASFEDPSIEIPGNSGLKDQVLALKWVQRNISKFGGNPNNVTIFGESAGGASVHLLMLSPIAKGLFHKAICQSGVAIAGFSRGQLTKAPVAKALGLANSRETDIIKILLGASSEKLLQIQEKMLDPILSQCRSIGPVIEPYSSNASFMTKDPQQIMSSGDYSQVPLVIGYTSREGFLVKHLKNTMNPSSINSDVFKHNLPFPLERPETSDFLDEFENKVNEFYYGNKAARQNNSIAKYLFYTDVNIFIPINNAVIEHTRTSAAPTYFYRVSIDTELNYFKKLCGIKDTGVAHADDLGYLFKRLFTPKIRPNSLEAIAVKRFCKLWSQFAKYGNPTAKLNKLVNVTWPATENGKLHFLDIGENLTVGSDPDSDRVEFWEEVWGSISSLKL